ncbi:MAG: DUF393 domain-containing protein [Myxococcales bacterium]|nr:DUF393 domain-containing protein [Myxococcales bacterium]
MDSLTILYDSSCQLCVHCREWLETQPSFVPMEFVPCDSSEARRRFGQIPWLGGQLVVVASDGRVWAGAAAFVMCLWALVQYREWAERLSSPALAPLAERFFRVVSAERRRLGSLFTHRPCSTDACGVPARGPYR